MSASQIICKEQKERGRETIRNLLIYGMIYLGSALMICNIRQYVRFARHIRERGEWEQEQRILRLPILLLVLFLCGYLAVGFFGKPDLIVSAILFGGSIFVMVMQLLIRRVADRIQKNEKLEARLSAAEDASRAKTFFLSNMSHDIRTPLNAILGYTTLARKEGRTQEEIGQYLNKIDIAGHQLLAIVNDVLEMSRIESGKMELQPEPIDIEDTVRAAGDLISGQMEEKDIRFTVLCDVKDRCVMCDGNQLDRILVNILGNACKFTPKGGEVQLSLLQTQGDEETGTYEIRIKDNGIGMSPEFAENIFQPFERERTSTVSRTQGTGLGMAITKKIVDMMNGEIEVLTEQGRGSEFIVTLNLPLITGYDPVSTDPKPCACANRAKSARLLLAEDNMINREIANELLTGMGFQVENAENGECAVRMVMESTPGYYSAVLMDIQMPVMDGYEAARAIRELPEAGLSKIPIIAMTANAFREDEEAAREAGMQGHIAKPIDVEAMRRTIMEVLDGKSEA